ncbi:MAG: cupin domain-containing protein [Candidatus Dormibacteria bacterium]
MINSGSTPIPQTSCAGGITEDSRGIPATSPTAAIIENPSSGERIVIRETSEQSGGARLTFELFLSPHGHVPAGHIHPHQVETFSVLEGQMRFRRGLRVIHAGPGQSVTMPQGTFHTFLNPGPQVARVMVQSCPALRMEEVLRAGAELGRRQASGIGRGRWVLEGISFLREYRDEVAAPLLPAWAIRVAAQLVPASVHLGAPAPKAPSTAARADALP